MAVPLLDLTAQYGPLKEEMMREISAICDSQHFILGPKVEKFEKEAAEYCHSDFAVGVTSGSDALIIALMVEGIGPGDEVITTPFTFFATVGAIVRVGATPVFADIDPVTFNIDPKKIEEKITPRTKAIIPVHLFGQAADMDPIMEIARKHNLVVIEDACQAIGAEYKGRRVGSIGNYGAFSFFPSKNLGCFGDGGMVTCNDPEKVKLLKIFRNHGQSGTYMHDYVGGNFRLDALQAAILSIKLRDLDKHSSGYLVKVIVSAGSGLLLNCRRRPPIRSATSTISSAFGSPAGGATHCARSSRSRGSAARSTTRSRSTCRTVSGTSAASRAITR